jgi:hypothetical protein
MYLQLIASALNPVPATEIIQRALWTLTFAAELVLLVVLFGRERARRYPLFTASVAFLALRMMAEVLLSGRVAQLPLQETFLTLSCLSVAMSLLVLVEMALRGFAGLHRSLWVVNCLGLVLVSAGVLTVWGPWPVWKSMAVETLLGRLQLMQLIAQKGDLFAALLTVGLGGLVLLFGRRFQAGWRSHTQSIVLGLAASSVALLALQEALYRFQAQVQQIVQAAQPNARQEYQRIVAQAAKLVNLNQAIFVVVLIWWIVWLWLEEPGAPQQAESQLVEEAAQPE